MTKKLIRIPVRLATSPYEIIIGGGSIKKIGEELLRAGFKQGIKILVVSNPDVAKPYSEVFKESLRESGYNVSLLIIDAGEDKKNLGTITKIHNAAFENKLERGSLMIGLGGGVVGDMTGFAAATWLRGISFVQVPTTLLAMVDASIGGKTGVNHSGGKNLIGAFHQPKLVLIDPKTLNTLPKREFRAGMAEVIKYGVIREYKLFELLEDQECLSSIDSLDENILEKIIEMSAVSKANIVELDEHEAGVRAILNYGHTFGHVIEKLCGYGTWLHGEAVSIGMNAIGELAFQLDLWSEENLKRQKSLLIKTGLPTTWPQISNEEVKSSLKGDKKVKDGLVRFVMPRSIGKVEIRNDISEVDINRLLLNLKQI